MEMTISIDLGQVARDRGLTLDKVQRTVELLDEGNTVPFITRYRKDHTGGLDEEQIRHIQEDVAKQRQLAERKQTILKSIESQGKLTPELAGQIKSARSPKHLEDLYLPFKPKKQTLATLARQRGLEPLALEILQGSPELTDLAARAGQFVNPSVKLAAVEDVLAGVRHILAEMFSERADLRSRLRRAIQRTGKLVSTRIEPDKKAEAASAAAALAAAGDEAGVTPASDATVGDATEGDAPAAGLAESTAEVETLAPPPDVAAGSTAADGMSTEASPADAAATSDNAIASPAADNGVSYEADEQDEHDLHDEPLGELAGEHDEEDEHDELTDELTDEDDADVEGELPLDAEGAVIEGDAESEHAEGGETPETADDAAAAAEAVEGGVVEGAANAAAPSNVKKQKSRAPIAAALMRLTARQQARQAAREAKKKKKQKLLESLYKDYYKYEEPLAKVPPHRVLAINRGERSQVLRVKVDCDTVTLEKEAEELLVPAGHAHADFLRTCVRDALARLVVPSLDREIRREMTDRAERHAVDVFIQNLRKLLLQPPVHGRRVLAVDPGFRSGCKLAAIDEFGNLIDHGTIHIIGPEQHRQLCRSRFVEMLRKHALSVIAIGNGTACRETEQLVAEVLSTELRESEVEYVIVNEAGASVYSTSPIGREELPKFDATVRGAVSIGRRLLDPLSELVKINPANIGVGLYQHDLKAKHLRESLDAVVESCVNYVGVDVNTASPALLRYVSGLNQLTARRLYEHRMQHGPFTNREQFKNVAGFGDATFVQAAGFLRIYGGDNPLDATWIHPESYDVARRVLERIGSSEADLAAEVTLAPTVARATPAGDAATATFASGLLDMPPSDAASADLAAPSAVDEPTTEASTESPSSAESVVSGAAGDAGAPLPSTDSAAEGPVVPAADPQTSAEPSASAPEASAAPSAEAPAETAPETAPETEPRVALAERVRDVDVDETARELGIGTLLLKDILSFLASPTRDPREDLPPPVFRRGIMRLEDLAAGMELNGTVLNVVDFGVFVDIGLSDSALVHISRLADRFIKDPHEVVGVGDVMKVWVVDVDKARRRVSLTAIQPGTERPREARPQGRPQGRPPQKARPATQRPAGQAGQAGGQQQQQQRPPAQRGGQGQGGGRPPYQGGGGRGGAKQSQQRPPRPAGNFVPKQRPPKPVRPISQEMIEGSEPMRTFSDLLQFYKKKKEGDSTEEEKS